MWLTTLESSAMTTKRSAVAATIFSRVCAAPPPLTSQPSGAIWSAPSIAMSSRSTSSNGTTFNPSALAASSVAGEVATQVRSSPRSASAGSRNATVEPVPNPTLIPDATNAAAHSAAARLRRSATSLNVGSHRTRWQESGTLSRVGPTATSLGAVLSIRVYHGPHSRGGGRTRRWLSRITWGIAIVSVLSGAGWWRSAGHTQDTLLITATTAAFVAAIGHAWQQRHAAWTGGLVVGGGGIWFLASWFNRSSALPFGHVHYTHRMGPLLLGVPLWLLLGWIALTYVALIAARRTAKPTLLVAVLAGCYLAATDSALQSALRHFGYTTWTHAHPTIPGIPGIPAQDFVGALLVAVVTMLLIDLLPATTARDGLPRLLFGWWYVVSVIGVQTVVHRPVLTATVAIMGGVLAMPYAYLTFVDRV